MPSSRASRRAIRNESRSETRIHSSTTFRSIVSGHVSLPIPSTRYGWSSASSLGGVDRALGIDADDLHLGLLLVEPAADARDRPAGADGDDDRVELAAGLLPDLGRGDVVVRLRVRHVRVLVGLEAAGDLLGEPRRDRVVRLRRVVVDRRRRDHDLGAVRAEHRDLLLAHLVGHDEDAAVALARRGDGEPDAGVARGRLDDRAARLELPLALGLLDHREADPVLHRAARVQVLELGEDAGVARRREPVEPYDRRRADELEEGRILARHRRGSLDRYRADRAEPDSRTRELLVVACTSTSAATTPAAQMPGDHPEGERSSRRQRLRACDSPGTAADASSADHDQTHATIATPTAPPTCCAVLISPDASPASSRPDARERGDRDRDEREREPEAEHDVAAEQVARVTTRPPGSARTRSAPRC